MKTGMRVQGVVPRYGDRHLVIPQTAEEVDGLLCVHQRAVELLLVVYYLCGQYRQRVEREPEQRQRQQRQ